MMIRVRLFALLCACLALPAQADTTYLILRHGEKPESGLGQLNCRGLNRALALPTVLLDHYGKPDALYAPNPAIKKKDKGVPYAYIRPLATIEPLAIRIGLPVNVEWGLEDIAPLVSHLTAQTGGIHVIAWEHHWGERLARQLLVALGNDSKVPEWDNADFDSIYVIRTSLGADGTRHTTFAHEQQGLDGQPETCRP